MSPFSQLSGPKNPTISITGPKDSARGIDSGIPFKEISALFYHANFHYFIKIIKREDVQQILKRDFAVAPKVAPRCVSFMSCIPVKPT